MRRRFFNKIGGGYLPTDNFIVFDKSVSDPANITISEDGDFLYRLITSGFYLDGSPADLTGPEGDVMVVFLEFWYKWYKVDDNRFLYHFADHDIDGTYIHVPESLVGAYKGYVSSNRLYSWSDVTPTTNVSLSDFRSYAKARGTGFQVIDFQQHCVIAMMLYAKYKTRNLQGVLGPGGATSDPATTTGSSNVNAGTVSGWIINIAAENGPFFDVVPTQVGGSDSTHYSDYYSRTSDSSLVLARSYSNSNEYGGLRCVGHGFELRFASCFPRNHIRSKSGAV